MVFMPVMAKALAAARFLTAQQTVLIIGPIIRSHNTFGKHHRQFVVDSRGGAAFKSEGSVFARIAAASFGNTSA